MAPACWLCGSVRGGLINRTMPLPTFVSPEATLPELQSNLRWLVLVLGLEIPRQSQGVNPGWLLLVLGLGLTEASCCLFKRI